MSDSFTITLVEQADPAVVLRVAGRLEASGAQVLQTRCRDLVDQGSRRLVLDMSAVSFISSSGLGVLLLLTEDLRGLRGELVIAAAHQSVLEVLDLLNLDQFLLLAPSVEEALSAQKA